MRVLLWHVHGSWTTSFVQGRHTYLVPVQPERGPDGRGRALTWEWPQTVHEVTPEELRQADVDVVVLQRPHELAQLAPEWLGRRPGK
ncbi:MAG TPA: glycosyltransferase family 1 protein, partial [Actinomycetota bacterium]|nr:glycosyltransferase family 1 protein [Actinomycetota bacterium]